MKYDLFERFNEAIMTHQPMIIVEGRDDFKIYHKIAQSIRLNVEIYQVHEFEDYEAGCRGVIKCIAVLQPKFEERPDHITKILGVIDRDIRPFRGELPMNLLGLFVTQYYSIETYFATDENLRQLIAHITASPLQNIDNEIVTFVQTDFYHHLETFYFLCLEALKKACVEGYDSCVRYEMSPMTLSNKKFIEEVLPQLELKKQDLNAFAATFPISIKDIRLIAKGKWYLYWFVNQTYPKIKALKEACKARQIPQCRSCRVGNYEDCLLKTNQKIYTLETLQENLLNFIDESACTDIIAAFQQLK